MKMGRIIIDFPENMSEMGALSYVRGVVESGRISEAGGMKHFCWVTTFGVGVVVFTRQKKRGQKTDSFKIEEVRKD